MFMTSLAVTYQIDATGELAALADTNSATFPLSMAGYLNSSANIARLQTQFCQKIHGITWKELTRQRILLAPCSPHASFQRTDALHQRWAHASLPVDMLKVLHLSKVCRLFMNLFSVCGLDMTGVVNGEFSCLLCADFACVAKAHLQAAIVSQN